jgi:site-specific recombinase XerC
MKEAAAQDDSAQGVRDRSLVVLTHDLALRRSEVAGLDMEHLEFDGGRVVAVWIRGKGRSYRERLTVPEATARALAPWLERRGAEPGPLYHRMDRGWSGKPERLSGESVAHIVARIGRAAGLERKAKAHGLRHQAITHAWKIFSDVEDVMDFARHRNYNTTRCYIDAVEDRAGRIAAAIAGE